ncbi:MAG: TetR/AcrR family transcriptional regulator [Gammaproteobacteria bacterium]|nr:TetR/AcrR family transcriptional regulator [Gammaproteobacteria bacterium]
MPTSPSRRRIKSEFLQPRRYPRQQRAQIRSRQILHVTAKLLEEVGIDSLTTLMIAKELNISVGSLYHYFPNKHAILNRLGTMWLEEMTGAVEEIENMDIGNMTLSEFVDRTVERLLVVYRNQRAVLPLALALSAIPELRHLDAEHDNLIISKMMAMLKRLGFQASDNELNRLGRAYLELSHTLLIVIVSQRQIRAERTLADLKRMILALFEPHRAENQEMTKAVEAP